MASKPGTKDKPIYLCGGSGAILDGGGVRAGYVLHLDGASYWRVLGLSLHNTFDGSKLSGSHADSWIDVKGNDWLIQGNQGRNSRQDGFQTHEVVQGWGTNNVFKGNVAEVNGPGFGFDFVPVRNNKANCDNKVTGAVKGSATCPAASSRTCNQPK